MKDFRTQEEWEELQRNWDLQEQWRQDAVDGGVGWDSSLSLDHVPDNVTWNDTRLGRQIGASAGTLLGAGWIGAGLVNIETGETNSGIAGTAVGIGMIAIARWLRSKD